MLSRNVCKILLIFLLAAVSLAFTSTAMALSLNQAKSMGLVGEMPNGYLGAVQGTPQAQAVVSSVNAQRRKYYEQIAKRNGTSLAAVQAIAGKTAISKSAPGSYIMVNGRWVKK